MNVEPQAPKKAEVQPEAHIPAGLQLTTEERLYLAHFPEMVRPYELAWLRSSKGFKGDAFEKARKKEAFRHGWNSAILMRANYFMTTREEQEEAERQARERAEDFDL